MAEAATVIQLIQFSGLVLTCCYDYIDKAKRAPKEIQNVIDETNSIKGLLERLQSIASHPNHGRFVILKSLNRENGPFQACSSALAELDEKLKVLTDASTVRRHLQWPLEAKGIETILARLDKLKSEFYTALVGDTAIQTDLTQDTVEEVRDTVQDMKAAEEKSRILQWLDGPDPSINHNSARSKREPGTCEWLLASKDFTSWFNIPATSQLLWLHAFPGAGKTVLSSAVIDHVRSQPLSADYTIIYYYFDFSNASRQTYLGFLRSLIRQVCARTKTAPKPAVELYDACSGTAPCSEQLLELLKDLLKKQLRAFLIIDALDECPESEDYERRQVLAALAKIKALEAPNLSIFVASRPEVDIKQAMDTICDADIDVQAAVTNEDIRIHIRAQMKTDPKLDRWQKSIKDEIEEKLMKDAGGSFRWAVCQLAEVRKCLKPARIRDELKNLPKDLDSTYSRILGNVPDMYHRELRTVLMLLSFSTRPMTIQEVAEATAVDLEEQTFTTDNRFGDPFDLLEVCSSLVSLTDVPGSTYSQLRSEGIYRHELYQREYKLIQFAHFSVKEYLLASRTKKSIPAPFVISDTFSHSQITQLCLIYLLDFNGGMKVVRSNYSDFPLLGYSALHWASHLTHAKETERDAIEALLMRVFDPNNEDQLLNFLNLHDPDRFVKELSAGPTSRTTKDFKPALYYASYYGLVPIVKFLLESLNDTELRPDVINSALTGAAGGGKPEVVDLLLDAGADPKSAICGDVLYAATTSGNAAVVKKLVDIGAPIRAGSAYEGNALHAACKQGNPEVIQLLLDHGFDVTSRCQRYGVPLSTALQADHADCVRVLLRNGADVNFPAEGYWNPLGMACYSASPELAKLLLEKGAKVNPSVNPLAKAAKRGEMELMKVLLKHGADINCSSDEFYGTPLKGAIQSKQPEVLEFVLCEGADINDRGGQREFPVDLAMFSGNISAAERLVLLGAKFGDAALERAMDYSYKEYLAKILLDRGADPNAEHKKYGCILQFAILKSSQECVEWLLEAGADPNGAPDGEYGTPLQAAVVSRKEELVRLLLEKGASVNPERICGNYGDPLCAAIRGDLELIALLLLDYGASLDRTGQGYCPPLQVAASKGFESMVRLLVDKGVKVHAVGGEYGTALRAALSHGHDGTARYLLDNGADLMQRSEASHLTLYFTHVDETFTSALEVAVASNKTSTVQLLIDYGLNLNEPEDVCAAAIGRAIEVSGVEMLKFMIDKGANVKKHGGKALSFNWGRWYEDLLEKTMLLIEAGANIRDYTGGKRHTALGTSIVRENWQYMDFLLDAGADPNVVYSSGLNGSALNEAIECGNVEAVQKLLVKGADVNLGAGHYGTPFVNTIIRGDEELYQLFLDHGAIINPPEPYGYYGNPIQAAVSKGYYDIAHGLLDRGANIHLPGSYESILTPACMGSEVGQVAMIKRLFSLGADIEGEDKPRIVDDEIVKGLRIYLTPIQAAALCDREDLAALLLAKGSRINVVPPEGTYGNPLQAAAKKAHANMVQFLLHRGADVNAVGGECGTALQAAVTECSDAVAHMLLDAGADPSIEGGYYGSALQAAARFNWKRYVQLFLDRGVPVNTNVGKYGNALAAAAKRAARGIVEILLAHGANANQVGGKYGTPLQAACCARGSSAEAHTKDIIQLLIDSGAEVDTKEVGKYGSALQAAAYHDRGYVRLLLKHGADPNAEGGKFGSPLKAARATKSYRIEKELLDHGAAPLVVEEGS